LYLNAALIVNQEGLIYAKDLGPGNYITQWPQDPIKEGWVDIMQYNSARNGFPWFVFDSIGEVIANAMLCVGL
jgi:hypothetical protein